MYQQKSFEDGTLTVVHPFKKFKAAYQVSSDQEASELLASLNRPQYLAKLASLRYRIETGGMTTEGGIKVDTDRQSQASLNSTYQSLANEFITTVRWKTSNGFIELDAAAVLQIAREVSQHVAKCFEAEEVVVEQIKAIASNEDLLQFNLVDAFNTAGGFEHYDPTGDFL